MPRPLLEGHGAYVFGVLVAMLPLGRRAGRSGDRHRRDAERLVTVRKTPGGGRATSVEPPADDASVGVLITGSSTTSPTPTSTCRRDLRRSTRSRTRSTTAACEFGSARRAAHELLHRRDRVGDARRSARSRRARRRRRHALFPRGRAALRRHVRHARPRHEELDVARDLLAGVRDHLQSKIAENQNEVGKKLTVIASLVLVPSFIVGYYGRTSGRVRRGYWTIGVSTGSSSARRSMQLALFRWRRWI